MTKPTKWVCAQRRLRSAWSEYSLCAQWVAEDSIFLHADSEDSDQTGRMPRQIWVFAGRTAILLVLSCRGSLVWSWITAEPRASVNKFKTPSPPPPPLPPPIPPVIYYWPFQGGASVVLDSNCQFSFAFWLSSTPCVFCLGQHGDHLVGKCCPLGFPLVLFYFIPSYLFVFLSC